MENQMLKPVEGQLEAYNRRDIDAFMQNYSQDVTVEDGAGNLLMQGWQVMYDSYKQMFADSPDLHCNLVSRIVLGEYILDEERVTGRSGNAGESHVVAVYRVMDGLIRQVRFLR